LPMVLILAQRRMAKLRGVVTWSILPPMLRSNRIRQASPSSSRAPMNRSPKEGLCVLTRQFGTRPNYMLAPQDGEGHINLPSKGWSRTDVLSVLGNFSFVANFHGTFNSGGQLVGINEVKTNEVSPIRDVF